MSQESQSQTKAGLRFALLAGILSVSFFGLLRVDWVEQNILLPFTGFQEAVACRIGGDPNSGVRVNLSCSASDVIALCMGFVLAFPVAWRKRLTGALIGLALISVVNTLRIATLTHAVRDRFWFNALHVYIWPGILLIVVSVYVFIWMNTASGRGKPGEARESLTRRLFASPLTRRFIPLTVLFVLIFIGASDWIHRSESIKVVATWATQAAGWVLAALGVEATVSANILRTANGGFVVTQECIATPLIPIYFAAALSLPLSRMRRGIMLLAGFPVFFLLGTARLLVLALPLRVIGSHQIAIHAFYQMLIGVVLILGAAWLEGRRAQEKAAPIARRAVLALLAGSAIGLALGPMYNRLITGAVANLQALLQHSGHTWADNQGALLILPAYQLALFAGLWIAAVRRPAWRHFALGFLLLILSHLPLLLAFGEIATHLKVEIHAAAIRALALLTPILLTWLLLRRARAESSAPSLALAEARHG